MNESNVLGGAAVPDNAATRVQIPFEFRGNGGEYFRIWIVNLLLTIVTLGIFSAWAKVRRLRYFYGSTFLDGQSFEYHGRPIAILKGRLVVFGAYVVFLVASQLYPIASLVVFLPLAFFGLPWIIMRSRLFQLRMSSYRNLRFNFHGTYGGALGAFVGWYFIVLITLGILFPMWVRKRVEYSLDNAAYGDQRFSFNTGVGEYFKFCYITFGLSFAAYLVFIFAIFSVVGLGTISPTGVPPTGMELLARFGVGGWLLCLAAAATFFAIFGYYHASFINASFGGIEVGSNYVISRLPVFPLIGLYVTNLLGIVFTLGLFYPWAKIRQTRFQLEHMLVDSDGNLAAFTATATAGASAVGDAAGDFFDVDFGL